MNQSPRRKPLKILFGVLLIAALVFGGTAYFVFSNLNAVIASFKPQIEKVASDALGASVSLGTVEASLFPKPGLQVKQVSIGSSPGSHDQGISLSDVLFQVEIIPLLSRRLEISTLLLSNPAVTLTQDQSGVWIKGLPHPAQAKSGQAKGHSENTSIDQTTPETTAAPIAISLKRFEVQNGQVTFEDSLTGKRYEAKSISLHTGVNLDGANVHLLEPSISTKVILAENTNEPLAIEASAPQIDLSEELISAESFAVKIIETALRGSFAMNKSKHSGKLALSGDPIALEKLGILDGMVPALSSLSLSGKLTPDLKVILDEAPKEVQGSGTFNLAAIGLQSGPYTLSDLGGDIRSQFNRSGKVGLTSSNTNLKLNGAPLSLDYEVQFDSTNQVVELHLKRLGIFGGTIEGNVDVRLLKPQTFAINTGATSLSIGGAMTTLLPGGTTQVSGSLESARLDIRGTMGAELLQSLQGTAAIKLSKGALKGVNIAGSVLSALKNLPFITGELRGSVPPEKRPAFDDSDTAFESLSATFFVANGRMSTKDLLLVNTAYQITAEGAIGFDSHVDMRATITFSKEYSEALVAAAKDFQKVLDKNGQLVVPLSLSGTAPKIVILPNLEKLLAIAAERGLKEQAGKALDKLLGGKGGEKSGLGGLLGF